MCLVNRFKPKEIYSKHIFKRLETWIRGKNCFSGRTTKRGGGNPLATKKKNTTTGPGLLCYINTNGGCVVSPILINSLAPDFSWWACTFLWVLRKILPLDKSGAYSNNHYNSVIRCYIFKYSFEDYTRFYVRNLSMFIYSLNPRSKNKLECLCLQGKIQTKKRRWLIFLWNLWNRIDSKA